MEVNLTGVQHSVSRGVPGGNAARGPIASSDVRLSLAASLRFGAIVYTLLLLRDAFMDGVIQQLAKDILLAMSFNKSYMERKNRCGRRSVVVKTLIRVNHVGCQKYGSFQKHDRGSCSYICLCCISVSANEENHDVGGMCVNGFTTQRRCENQEAECYFNCKILIEWLRFKKSLTRWWSRETGYQFRLSRYLREELGFLSNAKGEFIKHRRRLIALYNIVIVGLITMLSLRRILSGEAARMEDLTLLNDSLIIPQFLIDNSNYILFSPER